MTRHATIDALAARYTAHRCPSIHSRSNPCPVCTAADAWAHDHRHEDLRAMPEALRPLVLRAREDATLVPPSPRAANWMIVEPRRLGSLTARPGVDAPDHGGESLSDAQEFSLNHHLEDYA